MQTKVILAASGVLILIPALLLFFGEYANYPLGERVWLSLFQSVTPRTAGFNTADLTALSGSGRLILIILMLIGGSPGSTAGGIKTTSAAVLVLNAQAVFRKKKSAHAFGRRIDDSAVKTAATLLTMYLSLTLLSGTIISALEKIPLGACIFETASAIGTVGLSLGLTPTLGTASHLLLIGLMFFGRVGGLTLIYAAISKPRDDAAQYPVEKFNVG
jgi:trk system potassium uptake protein TrkH